MELCERTRARRFAHSLLIRIQTIHDRLLLPSPRCAAARFFLSLHFSFASHTFHSNHFFVDGGGGECACAPRECSGVSKAERNENESQFKSFSSSSSSFPLSYARMEENKIGFFRSTANWPLNFVNASPASSAKQRAR